MADTSATAVITAQNRWSAWVPLYGDFIFAVTGISDSTVTVQASPDGGATKIQADEFTAADADADGHILEVGNAPSKGWLYRWGVKTGDYGTDTLVGRIEQ